MYRFSRTLGYLALLATPGALLAAALLGGDATPTVGVTGATVLAGSVGALVEGERLFGAVDDPGFGIADAADGLAVPAAAVITYVLNVEAGLGPVVASALVGLVAGVALPEVDASAYCGTFVGMASAQVFPAFEYVALAGALSGAAYVATDDLFAGFGGKLGTIALFGCASVVALTGAGFGSGDPLPLSNAWPIVPVATAGAVAAVVASLRLEWGAVVGSAIVGLVAGVALPAVSQTGETLAAVAFCASFVGMSSTDRLRSEVHVAVAGGLCGLVFVAVATVFAGAGGKLGTIAFVSCLSVAGAERLLLD